MYRSTPMTSLHLLMGMGAVMIDDFDAGEFLNEECRN